MRLSLSALALSSFVAACAQLQADDPGICRLPTMTPAILLLGGEDYSGNIARVAISEEFSSGRDAISVIFDDEGRERFATQSTRMVGEELPVIVNDTLVTSPKIMEPIIGGTVQLSGNYSSQEALEIAKSIAPVCPPANN